MVLCFSKMMLTLKGKPKIFPDAWSPAMWKYCIHLCVLHKFHALAFWRCFHLFSYVCLFPVSFTVAILPQSLKIRVRMVKEPFKRHSSYLMFRLDLHLSQTSCYRIDVCHLIFIIQKVSIDQHPSPHIACLISPHSSTTLPLAMFQTYQQYLRAFIPSVLSFWDVFPPYISRIHFLTCFQVSI